MYCVIGDRMFHASPSIFTDFMSSDGLDRDQLKLLTFIEVYLLTEKNVFIFRASNARLCGHYYTLDFFSIIAYIHIRFFLITIVAF